MIYAEEANDLWDQWLVFGRFVVMDRKGWEGGKGREKSRVPDFTRILLLKHNLLSYFVKPSEIKCGYI